MLLHALQKAVDIRTVHFIPTLKILVQSLIFNGSVPFFHQYISSMYVALVHFQKISMQSAVTLLQTFLTD